MRLLSKERLMVDLTTNQSTKQQISNHTIRTQQQEEEKDKIYER